MAVNTESLLDKLYNLRGSDSEILKEMDRQKTKAEETRNRTTEEKKLLQDKIKDSKTQREELQEQGEKFKEMLQGIHREDYATVLSRLHIDFDPSLILDKLEKNLPRTIEMVERDTKKAEDELVKVENEMNEAITTIEEIGIRRDSALSNQEKLNEYFELSLSGRMNITRDSITSLIREFGFDEEEQREAAKILMFPEDALFSYNQRFLEKERSGKSISEVIAEAKTMVEEVPVVQEKEDNFDDLFLSPVVEEKKDDKKEETIELLRANGIDYLDFTSEEINDLIYHFDADLVQSNISYMKRNSIDLDIFINHVGMLYDDELQRKVELLLSVGKEALDIYLNPSVLTKYSLQGLNASIELLKGNGLDPKDVPLMAY